MNNSALDRMRSGEIALGVGVRLARSVEIAKMMRASDFDWLFIDLEHGSLSLETVTQISISAADNNIAPIVRVPAGQWDVASRALDGGAQGIVMPHVNSVEEAAAAVDRLRFPPLGHRSTLGGLPQYDYLPVKTSQVTSEINAVTLLAMMIESPRAVDNAAAIAGVEGIDVLFVGANDLASELGIPGQLDHPEVLKAVESVVGAAEAAGKFSGIGGVGDAALVKRYIGMGAKFILAGNDFSFMIAAAAQRANTLREK